MSRDALIVGINQYKYEGLHNLTAPAEDAEAITRILKNHGEFNVWRLPEAIYLKTPIIGTTGQVSLNELEDAIVRLFKPQGNQFPDTALLYFSGHGLLKNSGIQEGFLCTSDVRPNLGFYGLSLQWLRRLLQDSPIRQQIIWLDCCHSGELLNFGEANPGEQGHARDRCFIAASRDFESAYEDLSDRYSVLTKVLLEGLDPNRCPQEWITNYNLVDFLNKNLHHATQRPIFTNFGEAINLTRTWEVPTKTTQKQDLQDMCPYKGLEYFDCNDEDPKYFYGRERLTDQLIDKIRQSDFLAILGASGSGKSSVLRAGLLHQLKSGRKLVGSQDWAIHILIPGEAPLQNLALSFLDPNLSGIERATQLDQIETLIKQGAEGLRKIVQASTSSRMILVIDQFEEVFTLCKEQTKREKFFQCLLEAVEQTNHKLCVILAMRIDFFGKCFEHSYSGLGKKIEENLIAVSPMEQEELRQAITKPAQKVNLSVENELVEQMLRDIKGSPGSLPLLQYTLTELWKLRQDNRLTQAAYTKLGGIGGTLDKRATEVYNEFDEQHKETAKHIFLGLTQLGESTEDTRRRILKRDLVTAKHPENLIDDIVKKLADEKLIVTSEQVEKGANLNREPVIDVAHEALIRNWELLKQWLDESRSKLLEQRKIENNAQDWKASGYKSDYLLQGFRLKEAKKFQKESGNPYPLSGVAEKFIRKSIHQQRKNLVRLGILPVIAIGIIGGLAYRDYSIRTAWRVVQETQGEKYDIGRHEALETSNWWRENLSNAPLEKANLQNIDLRGANLGSADLGGANLSGANLSGANLGYADLRSADLSGAYLGYADLSGADLSGANLSSAYLGYADLSGADLSGADLSITDFRGVYLIDAKNLTPWQIKSACNWDKAYYKGQYDEKQSKWIIDEKANQQYIEQLKKDKASDPKEPPICSLWK